MGLEEEIDFEPRSSDFHSRMFREARELTTVEKKETQITMIDIESENFEIKNCQSRSI